MGILCSAEDSHETSSEQRIHMKHQALFYLKDKSEKLKFRLLHFFGALLVNNLLMCSCVFYFLSNAQPCLKNYK